MTVYLRPVPGLPQVARVAHDGAAPAAHRALLQQRVHVPGHHLEQLLDGVVQVIRLLLPLEPLGAEDAGHKSARLGHRWSRRLEPEPLGAGDRAPPEAPGDTAPRPPQQPLRETGRPEIIHPVYKCFLSTCCPWWVKNLPAMQQTQVRSLGQDDPLEKGMATHSSGLACRTPRTEAIVHGITESDTTERLTLSLS